MENFINCRWSTFESRVWSDSQGPFLEGLDFFLSEEPIITKGRKIIGKDYNGNDISLVKTRKNGWILLVKNEKEEAKLEPRSLETIEMVEAFWKAHPKGKYDYEKVIPLGCRDKVEIGCPSHGTFFQKPWSHKRGVGCSHCSNANNGKSKITTKMFIKRAKIIHGDRYNYSKAKYVSGQTPVIIGCAIHGDFQQKPQVHLQGSGCPCCSKTVTRNQGTTHTFIIKARMVHGDRYDYSKVIYVSALGKIIIICPNHGEFQQVASDHLSGSGCQSCNKFCFKPLEEFIRIGTEKYQGKYDYSRSRYNKLTDLVEIICSVQDHGSFWARATDHISVRGNGCPRCAWKGNNQESVIKLSEETHEGYYSYANSVYNGMKRYMVVTCPRHGDFFITPSDHIRKERGCKNCSLGNLTQEEFIDQSEYTFGKNLLDYSRVNYINQTTEVVLRCIKHNWTFVQKPVVHLRGKGCLKCAHDGFAKLDIRTDEWFRKEAIETHGLRFSYPNSHFKGMTKMITITCPKHGDFEQLAISHLQGCGCPKCNSSKGETQIRLFLESQGIVFEEQKAFKKCRDKGQLRYDFYIEKYNLLIEYDGSQHFFPVDCWGGMEALEGTQRRDKIKNEFAERNGHKLLRIRYDECVEQILDNFLEKLTLENEIDILKIMERFEECGWFRVGDRIWKEGQGPFLEGLDFFIGPTSEKEIKGIIIPLGKDEYGDTVVLASLFEEDDWILATKKGNAIFPLVERDVKTLDMVQAFWKKQTKGYYDYRFAVNTLAAGKVKIICPVHGEFLQEKRKHQNGLGCNVCSVKKIGAGGGVTTAELIKRSKAKFGDKLDYSKTECKGMRSPTIFICPEHGEFIQTPTTHLKSRGCPSCTSPQQSKIDRAKIDFKEKGGITHNFKFNYDKSDYKGAKIKVIITCPIHGDFLQTPDDHLKGRGCPGCANDVRSASNTLKALKKY